MILEELVLNLSTLEKALGRALNYQRKVKREQNLLTTTRKNASRNLILGHFIEDYQLNGLLFCHF